MLFAWTSKLWKPKLLGKNKLYHFILLEPIKLVKNTQKMQRWQINFFGGENGKLSLIRATQKSAFFLKKNMKTQHKKFSPWLATLKIVAKKVKHWAWINNGTLLV